MTAKTSPLALWAIERGDGSFERQPRCGQRNGANA
jgi:hypothetical protein